MKRIVFLVFIVAVISCTHKQQQADNKISLGTIDSIQSKILNENRKIWIYVPEGNSEVYTKEKYPVVYLLDGDAHFYSVVGMIQQLSSVNGNTVCPKMIVVGIPNTDRTRDLTPTHVDADPPYMDSASSKSSGGGEHFISFVEKELIPHIDSTYPTTSYRVFIGHSFGGLTAMNAFIHHTDLFNAYIVIDPSMWWDSQKLLNETRNNLATKNYSGKSLFLGIANTMEPGMDTTKIKSDTTANTKHIRSILALSNYFKSNINNGLKFSYKYYNDDDHGSVPMITEYDALRFIFDFYPLKLTLKDFFDPSKALDTVFENHYKNVSGRLGYSVKPPESFVNEMAYQFLGMKQYEKAEHLFKLNIVNYPESFNVYDSMGDLYAAKSDTANAIINYKKSLAIKEIPETREKLKTLTK